MELSADSDEDTLTFRLSERENLFGEGVRPLKVCVCYVLNRGLNLNVLDDSFFKIILSI